MAFTADDYFKKLNKAISSSSPAPGDAETVSSADFDNAEAANSSSVPPPSSSSSSSSQRKVILPPPDARTIIDKTAAAIVKRGEEFEEVIRENERDNPRFSFLNYHDPFHAYYRLKIESIKSGTNFDELLAAQSVIPSYAPHAIGALIIESAEEQAPEEPPAFEFLYDLPAISLQDLDVLKLTAQFVAKNGRAFMSALTHKEQKNPQFDFLRPNHSLYSLFAKFVDQYTKILMHNNNVKQKIDDPMLSSLREVIANKWSLLNRVHKRVTHTRYQMDQQRKAQEEIQRETVIIASIDWHDFVVVETIDFTDTDRRVELAEPITLSQLKTMSLTQKRELFSGPSPMAKENILPSSAYLTEGEVEMDMDTSEAANVDVPHAVSLDKELKQQMQIQLPRAMVMAQAAQSNEPTQICPLCQKPIPVSEMEEHMRIELLDPRYKEQRARAQEKQLRYTNVVGTGADVSRNLETMFKQRADIVGSGIDERKVFEQTKQAEKQRVIWDGRAATIAAATKAAQSVISPAELMAIQQQQQQQVMMAAGMAQRQYMQQPAYSVAQPPMPYAPLDESVAKKMKLDVGALIPESEFIAQCPGPIHISIVAPLHPDKPEFKLNGQVIQLTVNMTDTVYTLKERLQSEVGLPPARQKLSFSSIPQLKNECTIAYYNIGPEFKLQLSIRERGGRK